MCVLGICGSLQAKSGNLALLQSAIKLAPEGMDVVLDDGLRDLPHFNPDLEAGGTVPAAVAAWRGALSASDAVLIASPEYGHSLPGSLKNGIDWTIGSGEFHDKIVAITAAVPGRDRGRLGLAALRATLVAVSAVIVGGEPIARGPSFERDIAALLKTLLETVQARG
jgi:NAD(P)H-dependent FMN reductase